MKQLFSRVRLAMLLALPLPALLPHASQAQAPQWERVFTPQHITGANSMITRTLPDGNGNLYVLGSFWGTVSFGNTTLTSQGSYDVFLAKWSPVSESFVWGQQLGGTDRDEAADMVVRGTDIYVAGNFKSPSMTIGSTTLTHQGSSSTNDLFVTKLTDTGSSASFGWTVQGSGSMEDAVTALALEGASVYLALNFASPTLSIGGQQLNMSSSAPGSQPYDGVVVKLEDLGTSAALRWLQPIGGARAVFLSDIAVQNSRIYLAGSYETLPGQSVTLGTHTLPPTRSSDALLLSLHDQLTMSTVEWVQPYGGAFHDNAATLTVSGTDLYVGVQSASPTFTLGASTFTSPSPTLTYRAFVARFGLTGTGVSPGWVVSATTDNPAQPSVLTLHGSDLYVAGPFAGSTLTVGPTTLTNLSIGDPGQSDSFLTKLDTSGNINWTQQVGGLYIDAIASLTFLGSTLYVGGYVQEGASFGNQTFTLPSSNVVGYLATFSATLLGGKASSTLPGVALWPNPTQGRAEVRLPAGKGTVPFSISLTDALGRVVLRREAAAATAGQTIPLELAGLAPGVYAVRVQQGAAQAVQKLVVE